MKPGFRLGAISIAAALVALAAPWIASADVPWPSASTFDSCLMWCPGGDAVYHLTARKLSGQVFPSGVAVFDISSCPDFHTCPLDGTEPYYIVSSPPSLSIRMLTNQQGVANFPVRGGGTCAAATLSVDGVIFTTLPIVSPDLNGDGFVDAGDRGMLLGLMGTHTPTADFDCDGTVTSADLNLLMAHYGHSCAGGPTPARRSTWGDLKTIYR